MSAVADFVAAIVLALGASPDPDRIVPGRIVRFSTNGKRGDDAGWCKLFKDGRAGVYGDWRTGEQHMWHATYLSAHNRAERLQLREAISAARAARVEEEAQRHSRVADAAQLIWSRAQRCLEHPYLNRKQIGPDGARVQFSQASEVKGRFFATDENGALQPLRGLLLLVPLRDMEWRIWSIQAIDEEGRKAFLKGGRKRRLFHVVGVDAIRGAGTNFTGEIGISEGYATGYSVSVATGWSVFVALDAGNLLPVAQQVRARFPMARITVCGDCDRSGVGQVKAIEAATAVGGLVSIPPLTAEDIRSGLSDWNDWACKYYSKRAIA